MSSSISPEPQIVLTGSGDMTADKLPGSFFQRWRKGTVSHRHDESWREEESLKFLGTLKERDR